MDTDAYVTMAAGTEQFLSLVHIYACHIFAPPITSANDQNVVSVSSVTFLLSGNSWKSNEGNLILGNAAALY